MALLTHGSLLSQLPEVHTNSCDNISQFSVDSITSQESKEPVFIAAGDIRYGHTTLPQVPPPSQALSVSVPFLSASPFPLLCPYSILVLKSPSLSQ